MLEVDAGFLSPEGEMIAFGPTYYDHPGLASWILTEWLGEELPDDNDTFYIYRTQTKLMELGWVRIDYDRCQAVCEPTFYQLNTMRRLRRVALKYKDNCDFKDLFKSMSVFIRKAEQGTLNLDYWYDKFRTLDNE